MAQIVTITNPLTGQPVQVDQLEHTAQQIDDIVNASGIESIDYPGCYYRMVSGVVEWFNPPMLLGDEYRTTERYNGKPVYAYALLFDAMPSANSYATKNAPCKNVEAVIDCRAVHNTDGMFFPRRSFDSATDKPLTIFSAIPNGTDYIYVLCTTDSEGFSGTSATVLLKYTKTTDD